MRSKTLADEIRALETDTLLEIRIAIDQLLHQRRRLIERELQLLDERPVLVRHSIEPRYRSRRDPNKVWSGRGQLPRWMREEMTGTRLTKEDFRIKAR
jgi:DNA-binding protein H-NS